MNKPVLNKTHNISGESGMFDMMYTLKGVLISYLFSIIALLIATVFITYSPVPDSALKVIVTIISIVGLMISGFIVARKSRKQGWLNGAIAGLLYTIILYFIGSLILNDFSITSSTVIMIGLGFLCGALGGILGINMRRKK